MTPFVQSDIKHDEGCKLHAYSDTVGVCTIGYGHAGVKPGTAWTQEQAERTFAADFAEAVDGLDRFLPWWSELDDARQDVLANMAFNLGVKGLLAFRGALAAMRSEEWATASADMLASLWAAQVPNRAKRLARQMLTGDRAAPA